MANAEPVPAVLLNTNAGSQAELTEIVSNALNGRTVNLAADVLTRDNRLIIERGQHMRDDNPVMGRKIEKPDHFYLMKSGDSCILKHEETGETYVLHLAECQTISETP